tara:strand:+ start:1293 stop:1409 length:117 start_codon:yes stop_codon:yes gene_type:complete
MTFVGLAGKRGRWRNKRKVGRHQRQNGSKVFHDHSFSI